MSYLLCVYAHHNSWSLWNNSHGKRFIPVSYNKVMDLETQTNWIDNSNSVLFSGQRFLLKYDDKFGHITKSCCSFGIQNGKFVNESITLYICLVLLNQ